MVCWYDPNGISTVSETIAYIQGLSRFPITVLNTYEHKLGPGPLQLAPDVDFDSYAGVIFHNTVTYNAENLRCVDLHTRRKLKDFEGVKVLMKQDDNHDFRGVASHIAETGYDLFFTCLPSEAVARLYPPEGLGQTHVERMLTGYVTPTLRSIDPRAGERAIDIGYRGSIQPLSFGRLAYEKRRIGTDVLRSLEGRGLKLDISSRWEDRFGRDSWFDFLLSCKATLGTESGASVFDLDETLSTRLAEAEADLGPVRDDDDYAEAVLSRLVDLEDQIDYRQISPRHFEAAACGTLQLLHPGRYSDIFVAGRHYVSIARDGSDLDAAIAIVQDERRRREIVDAAHAEIILDPRYWIETFVARFDDLIEKAALAKGVLVPSKAAYPAQHRQVLLITGMEPRHDPRHGWTERHAPNDTLVHQIGVLESDQAPILRTSTRGGLYWATPRVEWSNGQSLTWFQSLGTSPTATAIIHELAFLETAYQLPHEAFARLFGAPLHSPRIGSLRFFIRVLLATTRTLVDAGSRLRGVQAIIASDLYTLPAAILLKEFFGVEVLYDAHEYMPEVIPEAHEFERQFFSGLEHRLVAHTAARQTVTPGLADLMSAEYGLPFDVVVNAEPNEDTDFHLPHRDQDGHCIFLFCGLFGSGRGVDILIDAWPETPSSAILHLQGPDNPLKRQLVERAKATGLLGTRIMFPDPVLETDIVASMRRADVGLIPYEPISTNHRFCCPNKMSQYMRAGLPILANDTHFVAATVNEAGCGRVANFRNRPQLLAAIAELTADPMLRRSLAGNARAYFEESFNWQARSRVMYTRLEAMLEARAPGPLIAISLPEAIPQVEEPPVVPDSGEAEGSKAPAANESSFELPARDDRGVWRRLLRSFAGTTRLRGS